MPRTRSFPVSPAASAALACYVLTSAALAQQPFTYQGKLNQNGAPFSGTANLEFRLFFSETGGVAIDTQTLSNVAIDNGLFTVILGDEPEWRFYGAFDGTPRWMEVSVNGMPLTPRQKITLAPQATFAIETGALRLPADLSTYGDLPALAVANGGDGYGIIGRTSSDAGGFGVTGECFATSGPNGGVYGVARSDQGRGVLGVNLATSGAGNACGGFFTSRNPTNGIGCFARVDTTGNANNAYGGYFDNLATSGVSGGAAGVSYSTEGRGLIGAATALSGSNIGVHGYSRSPNGIGGYFENFGGGGALKANGLAQVKVLQILGGSDLSEGFDISGDDVEPGMVVTIDSQNAGKLIRSCAAYDKKVAGIVSGAGGVNVGMIMGQDGSIANGKHPVALSGRVYCYVDATSAAIEPGDLLTTSDTPGHAMKALDADRAHGAIIGKAMTSLAAGERGLVLVLVNLQ